MIIIFLDCDQVLNSDKYLAGNKDDITTDNYPIEEVIKKQLNPQNVKNLNKILSVTGANVVLCSSWRKFVSLEQLCDGLNKNGMKKQFNERFISKTPISGKKSDEINKWLKEWDGDKVDKFAVVDNDNGKYNDLKSFGNNFFNVNPEKGLTPKKSDKIINFLISN